MRKHRISSPGDAATYTSSADATRASFHSPLHCMCGVWFSGVWGHRVAVGATGRSPATQTMRKRGLSPPRDAATYTSSAYATRASFHSPLHCLYGWLLIMPCKSPRSCRGDWKVARNTNHAKTRSIAARGCRHIYVISGRTAGELPLAPTLPAWIVIDNAL